jgi:hypothetical protein
MDKINPDHYMTGGIETIDFIKAKDLYPADLEPPADGFRPG